MFWGSFDPQTLFFIIEIPKSDYLTRKHAFWAINGRDRFSVVTCRREQRYKKRNTKSNGKCPPYADPLPVVPHQPNLRVGSYFGCLSCFWVSSKSVEKCGSCGGRNFGLRIDLAHRLYNSLLLPHKPWLSVYSAACEAPVKRTQWKLITAGDYFDTCSAKTYPNDRPYRGA